MNLDLMGFIQGISDRVPGKVLWSALRAVDVP